jgi:cytochrome c oxidase assembly protein subunit 15
MFGGFVPDHWSGAIAIHFAHRTGALVVTAMAITTAIFIWRKHTDRPELASPALLLLLLIALQIILGASTVLSRLEPRINSVHVVCGALVLTTSLVVTLRTWRIRFADAEPQTQARQTALSQPTVDRSADSAVVPGRARA